MHGSRVMAYLALSCCLRAGYESLRNLWLHDQFLQRRPEIPIWSVTLAGKVYDVPELERLQQKALDMFYHGYESYMAYAFPHDDLKPLSFSYTDSLGELGTDGTHAASAEYQGVAMTLIDTMSTLAVLGNATEFQRNVRWLTENLSFDVDVRVNVFEANIRLLGGLLSTHLLAVDPKLGPSLMPGGYSGGLLDLAYSLALRLLPAFLESPTGLPYAWVNLRHGMEGNRVITETNVAACGSLILEMATLSRLTGNPVFEDAAVRALARLWAMRSPLNLLGSSLDMVSGEWKDPSGGIGASSDSFYEYLLKAYILLGDDSYWSVFEQAYISALQNYKLGSWYHDSHVWTGHATHMQFSALQAFWPGMQVLAGDVLQAVETMENFMGVWVKFGVLPERYLFAIDQLHPTERYYPLRPEIIESNTYLYQATRDPRYLRYGEIFMDNLYNYSWTPGGWASIRNVESHEKEDHMHSFFLAETCKYLFLLYNDSFLKGGNYVFTTEGHPLPAGIWDRRRQMPPHQHRPPGNATLGTLLSHPFYKHHAEAHNFPAASTEISWTHNLVAEAELAAQQVLVSVEAQQCSTQTAGSAEESGAPHPSGPVNATEAPGADHEADSVRNHSRVSGRWRQPEEWGHRWADASALDARVCPRYGHVPAGSLCHVLDRFEDHRCLTADDCGTDAGSCRGRVCTQHGYCGTVVTLTQNIPNLASILFGKAAVTSPSIEEIKMEPMLPPASSNES